MKNENDPPHVSILEHQGAREAVRVADVIMARDQDGKEILVHGRDALSFVTSMGSPQDMGVAKLSINSTSDLAYLIAAVRVLKNVERADIEEHLG